jgi:hypothetical protein
VVEIAERIEEAEAAAIDPDAAAMPSQRVDVDSAPANIDDLIDSLPPGPGETSSGRKTSG